MLPRLRGLLARQPAQREDEQDRRGEVEGRRRVRRLMAFAPQLFRNIASMRRVTRKPPAMLIVANRVASDRERGRRTTLRRADCSRPPTTMMPLIALVTPSAACAARAHVPDDLEADEHGQHEDGEVLQKLGPAPRVPTQQRPATVPTTEERRASRFEALRAAPRARAPAFCLRRSPPAPCGFGACRGDRPRSSAAAAGR